MLMRPLRIGLTQKSVKLFRNECCHAFVNVAVQIDIQKESIFRHSEAVVDSTV
jgi:hypothetical protein